MIAVANVAWLAWLLGFITRLGGQANAAQDMVEDERLDRFPPWWELFMDAALWPFWATFDMGRWIQRKVWK